jgi:signal transduction histidine kinase
VNSAQDGFALSRDELLALVPANNIRHGSASRGEVVSVAVADLHPDDAATIRALYGLLGSVLEVVARRRGDGLPAASAVKECLTKHGWTELLPRVSALGTKLDERTAPPLVRKALHDIRGGGLPALVMHFDAVVEDEVEAEDIGRIFVLCRDQRKIVRNAIPDLDPAGYAIDLEPRAHTTELLTKWSTGTYRAGDRTAELHLRCDFEGTISECCMEFATLDRVVYNLVNNAARFASDGHVGLSVMPIRPDQETDLRIVVTNRVDPGQKERIAEDLGDEVSRVFQGGYTTGGTGLGLRICADVVCDGYSLSSVQSALERGYLGARVMGDHFVAWFHWPARRTAPAAA